MESLHWRYNFDQARFELINNDPNQHYEPLLKRVSIPTLVIDINLVTLENFREYIINVLNQASVNYINFEQVIFEHTQDPTYDYDSKCNILNDLSQSLGIKFYFAHVRFATTTHSHLEELIYPNQIIFHRRRVTPCWTDVVEKRYKFSCLNRNPSIHRLILYTLLKQQNLLEHFIYTFYDRCPYNGFKYGPTQYVDLSKYVNTDFKSLCLSNLADFPLSWDNELNGGGNDHTIGHAAFQDTWCHIVTETSMTIPYASEKTWKPIASGQLFLIAAAPGILKWLKSLGFYVFDVSYDSEPDLFKRLQLIVEIVKNNVDNPGEWWNQNKKYIEHNYYQFHNGNVEKKLLEPIIAQLNHK
jgi:hypothetical protein